MRPEPRSYEIQTQSGSILGCNRRHLRPAEDEGTNVDSDKPQIETLGDVPDVPDVPVVPGPGTSENPSASHSPEIYQTRSGRAVVRPAPFCLIAC